jgi:hypothetical protein
MRLGCAAFLSVIILLSSAEIQADDDAAKRAAAERLDATTRYDELSSKMEDAAAAMLPPEDRALLRAHLRRVLTEGRLRALSVEVYASVLDLEELEALASFYESSIGQRVRAKEPRMAVLTLQRQQCLLLELLRDVMLEKLAGQVPADKLPEARRKVQEGLAAHQRNCAGI